MEPVSNRNRTSANDPTSAELEAGACLPREPEPLQSRVTVSSAPAEPPAPAVAALVNKHPPSASAHPGVAFGVGINLAPPGTAVGFGASVGIVVDLSEPRISVFDSHGSGKATAPALSAGVSAQASIVGDVSKFWGSGAELGVNLPRFGAGLEFTAPALGSPLELNGVTGSVGVSVGVDGHYFEGTTTERWGISLSDIKDALKQVTGLPGPRRFGP